MRRERDTTHGRVFGNERGFLSAIETLAPFTIREDDDDRPILARTAVGPAVGVEEVFKSYIDS